MISAPAAKRLAASRFLRFALVGTAGLGVNEAVLWIALRPFGLNRYAAGLCSFAVAVTFTWWGNRTITFPDRAARGPRRLLAEWMKFAAANGLGFAANYAIYAAAVTFGPPPIGSPFLALVLGTLAGLVFNFVLSNRVVFSAQNR